MATPLNSRTSIRPLCFSRRTVLRFAAPAPVRATRPILAAALLFLAAGQARAQFQQPLVFSSGGAVVVRNDSTGALTPTAGSPFPATGVSLTIDVQGRYLFGIGVNSIHMYAITDSTTGAYQEVPTSPFASPNTNTPLFIAVEPTGNYLAVVNALSILPDQASAETFQISPNAPGGPALVPVPNSFTQLDGAVIGISQPAASAKAFYLYLGPHFPSNPDFPDGEELNTVTISAQTGLLQGIPTEGVDNSTARCYASDPQGRYIVTGHGELAGFVELVGIDGKFQTTSLELGSNTFPNGVWVDSTGTFLYVIIGPEANPPVHIYSLNLQTYAIVETASSPLPNATALPSYQPDPTGPFNYAAGLNEVMVFTVDPQTGYFLPLANSPLAVPGAGQLTFSVVPGSQGISGPSIQLSPTALSLGTLQIATPSAPQMITLTSNGAEALSVNSISVTGPNASEFLETDTCQAPSVLQPNKFCSISITFTPSAAGSQIATLTITDNAPGSPHSVPLSGDGVAPPPPAPAATIAPNPATFATITQGTTSGPMNIAVTNSGNATLHISSVVIGGNNPADFLNPASNCSGAALAPNASCSVSATFAPLAAGQRTETVTLTDDAPNSPQVLMIQGNANPAISVAPAPAGSTTATIPAGGTAQYQLQITPGANYTGTVTLACSGVPLAATCVVPSMVQVSNGTPANFSVVVNTTGATALAPPSSPETWRARRFTPLPVAYFTALSLSFLLWLCLLRFLPRRRSTLALAGIALATIMVLAGCGGGASSPPPVQIVTPQGTSKIVITPSANTASGQPLQLPTIQLTLTVN